MIPKLRQAFDKVEVLSEPEQEALADRIMETLDSEERIWDDLFARPEILAPLQKLADEALAEHRRGESLPLDDFV
jgi:hypothetical protein